MKARLATVGALVAAATALGGTSYAAATLAANSVGTAQLKAHAVVNRAGMRRIEVTTVKTAQALRVLQTHDACESATIFGQSVHAVVRDELSDDALLADLQKRGFTDAFVRDIAPSLEDVFVELTEDSAQQGPTSMRAP